MRIINTAGLITSVPDDVAAILIRDKEWQPAGDKPPLPTISPEKLNEQIRDVLTGGVKVPPNIDWIDCFTSKRDAWADGAIKVRLINGVVQFKGSVYFTQTSASSSSPLFFMPEGIPMPEIKKESALWAAKVSTGALYRVALVSINSKVNSQRTVAVSAPTGDFEVISFNGLQYTVF